MVVVTLERTYQGPFPKWYNPDITCAYHGGTPRHWIEQCLAFKTKVQSLIKAGWLTFQEDGPNVKTNPLANHGGPAVNVVEECGSRQPKHLGDVITSRRFIFEALQEAGVVPPSGNKEDPCLMHPGLPHDMETCMTLEELLQRMIDLGQLEVNSWSENEQHVCMQSADMETPKKSKPLVIYFTRVSAPQRHQDTPTTSSRGPASFPYKSSKAVPWKYAPLNLCEKKEDTANINSLLTKVTNITELSGVTRSSRILATPDLPAQPVNAKGKAKENEGPASNATPAPKEDVPTGRFAEKKVESSRKEVSVKGASEFLRIIQQSEYKIIEQLNKSPARVSLLELLMSSEPHQALLIKVLNEAHVAQDMSVEGFEGIVNNITANNYLTFTEEEIPAEGRGHNRTLHISVKCMDHVMAKVLIDNGSSLNMMPKSTLEKLPFNASHLRPSTMIVQAFNGSRREVRGEIDLSIQVGPHTCKVTFQVININPAYSCLLGRPWIHSLGVVPLTLHQKLKFMVEGLLVIVSGEEDLLISFLSSMPYVEATEEALEMAFQSFEIVSNTSVESLPMCPRMSSAAVMVAHVMLGHGY